MTLPTTGKQRTGSTNQVLTSAIILGICVVVAAWIIALRERDHQEQAKQWAMQRFGLLSATSNSLHRDFLDVDQDLVADAPTDEGKWVRPEKLTFSYIVSEGPEGQAEVWQSLMDSISTATGLPVEYLKLADIEEQLAAIRSGELHITGLNTGSVPRAVNACGFVPIGTLAGDDQAVGLRSLIIVPAGSAIYTVDDLKDKLITFTTQNSNSGFKAPLALLSKEMGMNPAIDYEYAFAGSHDKAIDLIAKKQTRAAAVASDLLDRAIANGDITHDQYRVVYESERFPPAAFGHAHNLDPEIAGKIRAAMTNYELAEGPLRDLFAHITGAKIVPVSYKDDWALIRRIDNSLGVVHEMPDTGESVATETASTDSASTDSASSDSASSESTETSSVDPGPSSTEAASAATDDSQSAAAGDTEAANAEPDAPESGSPDSPSVEPANSAS